MTTWERAARDGDTATLAAELAAGADVNALDRHGQTALMLAVINGHELCAKALAAAGADLRLTGSGAPGFAGKTAAQLAEEKGLDSLAKELTA